MLSISMGQNGANRSARSYILSFERVLDHYRPTDVVGHSLDNRGLWESHRDINFIPSES